MQAIVIKGERELLRKLNRLEDSAQRKIARKATGAGGTVLRKAMAAAAPAGAKRAKSYASDGVMVSVIGARGAVRFDFDPPRGRPERGYTASQLIEDHELGDPALGIPPSGFMRRSFNSSKKAALAKVDAVIGKELAKVK